MYRRLSESLRDRIGRGTVTLQGETPEKPWRLLLPALQFVQKGISFWYTCYRKKPEDSP